MIVSPGWMFRLTDTRPGWHAPDMENTDTLTHIDIDRALANTSDCIACHRKVSKKALDSGRATMVPVALDGTILTERSGQFYNLVIGPECRSKVGA